MKRNGGARTAARPPRAAGITSRGLKAAALAALVSLPATASGRLSVGDIDRAARARAAILEIDVPAARDILKDADPADTTLALERGRLAIYEGDCDGAAAIFARPDLAATAEGAALGDIARGCARGTAATVVVNDEARGVWVRLQDDDDRALVPLLVDVAARMRDVLARDLGVELLRPLRIDLVRDQFTLSAMTGLPEEAARTTGTVAIAKWGRVTMLSPRATPNGYPWLDTLAHEMTHLALSRGTRDNAPLWLQEGVAKREEVRWREPDPLDDVPSSDALAFVGLQKGLGRPLDKLGPSIAMLPSAEEAMVAFAEVASFIKYWTRESGDDALPRLLVRLKEAGSDADLERAIAEISGADLAAWDKRWRAYLATVPSNLPPDLAPGGDMPHRQEVGRRVRLGQLLHDRGHYTAAAIQHARAQALAPNEPAVRCFLAASLLASGERASAAPLVEQVEDVHSRHGRWWSLHGLLHGGEGPGADRAFSAGIELDPLSPEVACEEKLPPELPGDPIRSALCEAARRTAP
ncbi:hypothetical protein SOCE26_104980 [Sorangium cellulosum]|uniref:Uncharacterized protein n=1 Tax=Sorangium cellulosum TaxID=56 RepID=A0A2L0FBP7_SORCE|nr:hypothetical protein [Sorangium cellulosum]AUX48953.1 hypothetical protein SOCE26_104980 [Sorangium cellulosum]